MVYSTEMRAAVGAVRTALDSVGLGKQSDDYKLHGEHAAAADAPLLLVACSGGRDSLALAVVAKIVAAMNGLRCGALIIDHGLLPGSSTVAAGTARTLEELGLSPVLVRGVHVDIRQGGAEAAARDVRYAQFVDVGQEIGAAAVLVAHTQDDQVETVLLGMVRGSSPSALVGMPAVFEREGILFLRPFLSLTRQDTTRICQQNKVKWWDDPTNGDAIMPGEGEEGLPLRSRLRQQLLPVLKDIGGQAVMEHITLMSATIRADQDYLEAQADQAMQALLAAALPLPGGQSPSALADKRILRLDADALADLPVPIRLRVLRKLLESLDQSPIRAHLERIDDLVMNWHGQSPVKISRQFSALREGHVIQLCQDSSHANS